MINLLPPLVKEQIAYSKKSVGLFRYIMLIGGLGLILAATFLGAEWYVRQNLAREEEQLASRLKTVESFKGIETEVRDINGRLQSISTIQKSQAKFSNVLTDLAAALPKGAFINAITLTGDERKPLKISLTADSYATAVACRTALALSPRIANVDIDGISATTSGFRADITLAFKPGLAK